jgi:hypothetical protein
MSPRVALTDLLILGDRPHPAVGAEVHGDEPDLPRRLRMAAAAIHLAVQVLVPAALGAKTAVSMPK